MKKVLFINDLVYGGGVEKVLKDIVTYLADKSYEITVLTIYDDSPFYNFYPKEVKHVSLEPPKSVSIHRWSILKRAKRKFKRTLLMNKLNKANYDTIVAIKEGQSAILASKIKTAKKRLAWIHVDFDFLHWTKHLFKSAEDERRFMSGFDNVVCVSDAVKRNVIKAIGNPGNLIVKYNALDADDIIKKSSEKCLRRRSYKKPLFVTVGRLCIQKGYAELIRVCAELRHKFDFELWIIGGGDTEYKTMLDGLVTGSKLEDTVFLLGNQINPYPYVRQADWFVCSSVCESFGIAIHEALILNVPVIMTNCPGACELLDDKFSIVVDNMTQMEKELEKILSDSSTTDKYKQRLKKYYHPVSAEDRLRDIEMLL